MRYITMRRRDTEQIVGTPSSNSNQRTYMDPFKGHLEVNDEGCIHERHNDQ